MKPHIQELTVLITLNYPTRQLEAEVNYIVTTTLEPRPYGDGVAYQELKDFAVQHIDYLTEDLTVEEKKALDDKILEGPYE